MKGHGSINYKVTYCAIRKRTVLFFLTDKNCDDSATKIEASLHEIPNMLDKEVGIALSVKLQYLKDAITNKLILMK